jgi:t-SNARE complex subunit (syntaxin)
MCTVLLPPGGYPTAVNKYIIYHIIIIIIIIIITIIGSTALGGP